MQISVLIMANAHCLVGSSIYELLAKDELVGKVCLVDNQEVGLLKLKMEIFSLVIVLVDYPISRFLAKLNRVKSAETKVLLIFDSTDKFAAHYMAKFSVDGLVSTAASYQELRTAVHTLAARRLKYISPSLISATTKLFDQKLPFSRLSQKELDVAMSIMNGKRNVEIAEELNISYKTVSTYKARIYKKLEVASDVQLMICAQKMTLEPSQSLEDHS